MKTRVLMFAFWVVILLILGALCTQYVENKELQEEIKIITETLNAKSVELESAADILKSTQDELETTKEELEITKEKLQAEIEKSNQLNESLEGAKEKLQEATDKITAIEQGELSTHNGWSMCWREVNLELWEIDFFAKLLYCEAGGMGYEGQYWVASAILNLSELNQMSIWEMGHNVNMFSVAPYVDYATPMQAQYEIIYEVLRDGWIADVSYFRTDYYHSFGQPMTQIENVCFSRP